MEKRLIKSAAFALVVLSVFLSGCLKSDNQDTGFLQGVVSIGPLCPVETIPPQPQCLPTAETFKAYPIGIWTSDGETLLARIYPDLSGAYRAELLPGIYQVKLLNEQTVGGSNLPVLITINAMEFTVFNINIDTGIR